MTLWDEIVPVLPPAELDEVKRLLGPQLIDSNQALQSELQALTDICESMKQHTESCNKQQMFVESVERSLVERDLKFLVSRLCCSRPEGQRTRCSEASAVRSEQYMQRYIQERPSCGIQLEGHHVFRPASSLSSEGSLQLSPSGAGKLEGVALRRVRKSFVQTQQAEMQAVKHHFQEALAVEQQALLSNIEHMHACLAEEADMNAHAQMVPPPLAALRAYSARLQAQLQEEEAQQRHEQRLDRLAHITSRSQARSSPDGLAASFLPSPEPLKVPVKMASRRPDTAFEGGYLPADVDCKPAPSGIATPAISDGDARHISTDKGLGTEQDLDGGSLQSGASLQAEKLPYTAHLCSQPLDSLPGRPLPPERTGTGFKPSPRPCRACKKPAVRG